MIEMLALTLLGLFLGMRHATDPDHVIAVGTIVARQPTIRSALLIGSLWGVGHSLTIVAVGGAMILFSVAIPPRLGLTMEMAVALMLILLGIWSLAGFAEQMRQFHLPQRNGVAGLHLDFQRRPDTRAPTGWLCRQITGLGACQVLRPLIVGLVHGLAGSAAVALLVLALIRSPWWCMAYLGLFGIGTIAGMILITAAMGAMFTYTSRRFSRLERHLRLASGLLSLGFGLFLVYQIGVVDGLLAGHPGVTAAE